MPHELEDVSLKLDTCPLCGGEAEYRKETYYTVKCKRCGAHTTRGHDCRGFAATTWNDRHYHLDTCPLCGGRAHTHWESDHGSYVSCDVCGFATGGHMWSYEAIRDWNRGLGDGA